MTKKKKLEPKYQARFYKIVPTVVFSIAGLFYLTVPYNLIVKIGLNFRANEGDQVVLGIVFLIVAGIFWLFSSRKRK